MRKIEFALVIMLSILITSVSFSFFSKYGNNQKPSDEEEPFFGPARFEQIGTIVGYSEVVGDLKARGAKLYLPGYIPNGYNRTAIWAKSVNGEIGFPLIILYSKHGDTQIVSAEICIEIYGSVGIPFIEPCPDDTTSRFTNVIIEKQSLITYIDERAGYNWPGEENDYSILMDVWINGINYLYRIHPSIGLENAMRIIESMKLVT
jgi:hypothetical protein